MTRSFEFYVLVGPNDQEGTLNVTLTDEGVVLDLFDADCNEVGTWGRTAQELTEMIERR